MSNTSEIKQRNVLDIIKVIRKNIQITKPEITRQSNLTSVTVHNYITELIDKNLVVEDGNAESNGGRKAILYKLNPKFGYIISQNLGTNHIETSVFDMELTVLYRNKITNNMEYSDKVVNMMSQEIDAAIQKSGLKHKDCIGIGITVPGQVDHESGVIINLTNVPGWRSIPIKNIIENKTGIMSYVDNDNNANALAAKWLNIVKENSDTVFISITSGVGTGILTKGRLFYGSHSSVGEIGHTTIQFDGPECTCGSRGCIEALTSDAAIIDRVRKNKKNENNIDISTVIALGKKNDETVCGILRETAGYIVIAIDHIIKLYGPDNIIIDSNWLKEFEDLFYYITDNVFTKCTWVKRENLNIFLNPIKNIESIGAATLVFEYIFDHSDGNSLLKAMGV